MATPPKPSDGPKPSEGPKASDGQRIAKLLARAGVASRRDIERMIAEGRVALDGNVIDTPATLLTSLRGISVDGQPVRDAAPTRLFRYHKPAGLLTAARDPMGRATIYDRLPRDLPRLMPVGRLDLNTEGLLLLTTDGELKRQLELPSTGVTRSYRARAFGDVSQEQLEELIHGIEIEGVRYGSIDANLERRTGRNQWIEMRLTEGKNREVRRVLEHLGLQVSRLIRTAYGPFVLGDLPPGAVDEIRQHELVEFRKGLKGGAPMLLPDNPLPAHADDAPAPRFGAEARAKDYTYTPTARPAPRATPRPERPARDERPRPPRAADDRTAYGGRSDRPMRDSRPDRTARDERPHRSSTPDGRTGRDGRPDRTARDGRPERTARDGRPERPARDERPSRARTPEGRPPREGRPERPSRDGRPERPARDGRPARSDRAASAERPRRGQAPEDRDAIHHRPPRGATAARPARGAKVARPAAGAQAAGAQAAGDKPARPKRGAGWAKAKPSSRPTRRGGGSGGGKRAPTKGRPGPGKT